MSLSLSLCKDVLKYACNVFRHVFPFFSDLILSSKAFHFLHALFMFFLAEACSSRMVWRAVPGVTGPTIPTHHFVLSRVSWASKLPYLDVRCLSWVGNEGCMVQWLPWMWAEWFVSCKCLLHTPRTFLYEMDILCHYNPIYYIYGMPCKASEGIYKGDPFTVKKQQHSNTTQGWFLGSLGSLCWWWHWHLQASSRSGVETWASWQADVVSRWYVAIPVSGCH